MAYLQLTGGAYQSRTLISAAQRCLNLYIEHASQEEGKSSPVAHNCTPGLVRLSTAPQERIRCLYRATTGDLFACAGQDVYYVRPDWTWEQIGHFQPSAVSDAVPRGNPVSMCDNGITCIVCDNTVDGYQFDVASRAGWARMTDDGFYGSTRFDYLDTFFLANKPNTPIWYVSGSEAATWDPLDFASKVAFGDNTVCVVTMRRNAWILGRYSCEVWYNSGGGGSGALSNNNFPFDILPSAYHDVGILAPYSLGRVSDQLLWLSQDGAGKGVIIMASGYNIARISTHAIETEFSTYADLTDATGYTYQQQGHVFYVLNFTNADKTWVYDLMTKQWHERCWLDANGKEHRHRANNCQYAYDTLVCGDFETGDLYKFDLNAYTDAVPQGNGVGPIKRLRSFPHILDATQNRRVFYKQVIANMAVGTSSNTAPIETVVRSSFSATDGTLLESYTNTNDVGKGFALLTNGSEGEILKNQFTAVQNTGEVAYQSNTSPTSRDYSLQFRVTPSNYNAMPVAGSGIWAIGRAIDLTHGYQAGISSDGADYSVFLTVLGTDITQAVNFGTLASPETLLVTLTMYKTLISVSVRVDDVGMWIDRNGERVGSQVNAISIGDATYSLPGNVIIGGDWLAPLEV